MSTDLKAKAPLSWPLTMGLFVACFLAQCAFASLGVFFDSPEAIYLSGDSRILHDMAKNGLEHGVLTDSSLENPSLYQLPGYPLLAAAVYSVFGVDARYVLGLQFLVFSLAITGLICMITRQWGKAYVWFALLFIFDIHQLLYANSFLTEFWLLQCLLLSWYGFYRYDRFQTKKALLLGFVGLGLAINVKPLILYFPLCLMLSFTVFYPLKMWRMKGTILLGLGVVVMMMLPLLWRNYKISGEFPRYSNITSLNLWFYNIPAYKGKGSIDGLREARAEQAKVMVDYLNESEGRNLEPMSFEVANQRRGHYNSLGLNEYEYSRLADQLSKEFLKEEGLDYVIYHLSSALNTFRVSNLTYIRVFQGDPQAYSFGHLSVGELIQTLFSFERRSWYLWAMIWEFSFSFMFLGLSLLTLIVFFKRCYPNMSICFAYSLMLYIPCASGVITFGRFRYVLMPFMILMTIQGFRFWMESRTKKLNSKSEVVV